MDDNKYYWAIAVTQSYWDWDMYYDEEDAKHDQFSAYGNRDYNDFNGDLREDIVKLLLSLDSDVEVTVDHLVDEDTESSKIDDELLELARSYVKWYHNKYPESVDTLYDYDLNYLIKMSNKFEHTHDGDIEDNIICEVLWMFYKKRFKHGTISGNSQGDWMYYICPEDLSDEHLEYIEAVIMGTGYEYEVVENKCTVEEIKNADFESYTILTTKWRPQDVAKEVANEIGCQPSEVCIKDYNDDIWDANGNRIMMTIKL